jgi:ferredoxin
MAEKGGIEATVVDGERRYANAPLVVGMYELQVGRLTPEFLRDFEAYTGGSRFGLTFLGTHLPQMRTIPVARSVTVRHHVSRFDEVASLLREAEGPFVILECICRKSAAMKGRSCAVTDRRETCLGVGSLARTVLTTGNGREIDRSEALAIVERNQKEGLVLQPSNTRRAEFICSCCGCCCGMLGLQQALPKPLDFWATNFYAVVDRHACDGCGACTRRCQVGAVQVLRPDRIARIDRHRCIGCGLCVAACPRSALALQKKPNETRPPATRQELMDLLQAHRKGPLQRWMLAGKLLFDALRTRRLDLLR